MTAKSFETFFQPARAGEKRAGGSLEQHCPLQITETKMPASPEENPCCSVFQQTTSGGAPEDQRKKGKLAQGPGLTIPGPPEFRWTRPQNHSEAGKKSGLPGRSGVAEGLFWAFPGEQ